MLDRRHGAAAFHAARLGHYAAQVACCDFLLRMIGIAFVSGALLWGACALGERR